MYVQQATHNYNILQHICYNTTHLNSTHTQLNSTQQHNTTQHNNTTIPNSINLRFWVDLKCDLHKTWSQN